MAVRHGMKHQVGRARNFERGAVGVGRGVEVEQIDAGRQRPIQLGTQAARRGRQDGGACRLAAVGPMRGAGLRVEVDDRGVSASLDRRDGQMEGERRFPAPAFLADKGDRAHALGLR